MNFFESRLRLIAPLVVMCCLMGVSGQVAQAQVVTNGSFEAVQITSPFLSSDPNAIPGWTHTGNNGDALIWGVGYVDGGGSVTTAGQGSQFVTMGGGAGAIGSADWSTTITALTPGSSYVLSFMTSTETSLAQTMTVSFSSGSSTAAQAFTPPVSSTNYWMNWVTEHYAFVATASSATVHFSVTNQQQDMGLDNVSVAPAITYTSDPNIAHFTAPISSYAAFSNYSSTTGCTASPFTPTAVELLTTSCRVFGGKLAGTGLATNPATQNWILASFPEPVSTIVVFPNIDHFGSAYDGYQYTIAGSNDGLNWTPLFDATSVNGAAEPFTLGGSTGTAPTSVNNVLTPQSGSIEPCSGTGTKCSVGYIATFNFPTAYQFYAFGVSTVAFGNNPNPNPDQELSAVGTTVATAARFGIFPPTSGALLTINGTVGATVVNRNIYDSQIHTGTVRQVPVGIGESNCNVNDQTFPTDAYVLQGSSWTGCDAGDTFEFQASGSATVSGAGYNFAITTSYTPGCNHNSAICVGNGASTGFLTITNTSGAGNNFSGTITLSGTPVGLTAANAAFCPPAGGASDTITTLAANASAVLALSTDSSDCGGFNQSQTKTLTAGMTSIFQIGSDDYQINPFNSTAGDMLTVLPVPVPAGPVGAGNTFPPAEPASCTVNCTPEPVMFATTPFSATNFPGQACIAYDDLSAAGNPVCLEFQLKCVNNNVTCADALTFLYTAQIDFTKDTHSLGTIGGTAFLGQHDGSPTNAYLGQCPTNGFNLNNFFSYTATAPDPITGSGRGNSCYVGTFDPTAAPIPVGQTLTQKTFVGFQNPVSNTAMNMIKAGQSVPLIWQTFSDPAGTIPVTNLTLCQDLSGASCPSSTPWVFIGTIPISCLTDDVGIDTVPTVASGSSGLQNFGNGTYQFNMKTSKTAAGCFTTVLGFSTGLWSIGVADFKFTH